MQNQKNIKAVLIYEENFLPLLDTKLIIIALDNLKKIFPETIIYTNIKIDNEILEKYNVVFLNNKIENDKKIENNSYKSLFECLTTIIKNKEFEEKKDEYTLALTYSFYPLLDKNLSIEAFNTHNDTIAHFTFGENIPIGVIPDFLSYDFITSLNNSIPNNILEFREFVLRNIEDFDIEIFYQTPDLRQYRLDLSTQNSRSRKLTSEILNITKNFEYKDLDNLIKNNPQLLRPFYSYFELELCIDTDTTPNRITPLPFYWLPRNLPFELKSELPSELPRELPNKVTDELINKFPIESDKNLNKINSFEKSENTKSSLLYLEKNILEKLANDIEKNGLEEFSTISFGGKGEPVLHPNFFEILETFLNLKNVQTVFIESFGTFIDEEFFVKLNKLNNNSKIQIIIHLSTLIKDRYEKFYKSKNWEKIETNLKIWESNTKYKIHLECLRIQDNDDEMESFMNKFKDTNINVILQKYNSYTNLLPERRVADFNPLHRDFCWHLANDLYMDVFGNIPLCKQDPYSNRGPYINYKNSNLKEILNKTLNNLNYSVRHEFEKIPLPCLNCDEWYTFNA